MPGVAEHGVSGAGGRVVWCDLCEVVGKSHQESSVLVVGVSQAASCLGVVW